MPTPFTLASAYSSGFHRCRWLASLTVYALLIAGCVRSTQGVFSSARPAFVDQPTYNKLRYAGAELFQLGDELKLSMPTHKLFLPDSLRLQSGSHALLKSLVGLLNQRENAGVRVTVITDCTRLRCGTTLAEQQAVIVADALARGGLNTRLLYPTARSVPTFDGDRHNVWQSAQATDILEITTRLVHLKDMA